MENSYEYGCPQLNIFYIYVHGLRCLDAVGFVWGVCSGVWGCVCVKGEGYVLCDYPENGRNNLDL